MPTIAILSDIHGNLEALTAVLADVEKQGVDAIYFLGDVVGYGPNPVECIDHVMTMSVAILGNHDLGVLFDPEGFCNAAERAIFWSRSQLASVGEPAERQRRFEFLFDLPRQHLDGSIAFVHGSPHNPINEYVFPEDVFNPKKMQRIAAHFDRLCFVGHTHVPGVFHRVSSEQWTFDYAEEYERNGLVLSGEKLICNVGSVGQPRDGDERACYAIFDGERFRIRRVDYDIETTIRKIYAVPELENFLGDRLREGR